MTDQEITNATLDNATVKFGDIVGTIRALFFKRPPENKLCAVILDEVTERLHVCEDVILVELVKK